MECARTWEDGAAHGCSWPDCCEGWEPSLSSSFSSSSSLGHEGGQQLFLEVMDWHQDTSWLSLQWDKGEHFPFVGAAFGGGDLSSSLGLVGSLALGYSPWPSCNYGDSSGRKLFLQPCCGTGGLSHWGQGCHQLWWQLLALGAEVWLSSHSIHASFPEAC